MPWWDQPGSADEIDACLRDLETVDHVLADLPHGSRDWLLADQSSIDLGDRLQHAVRRAERGERTRGSETASTASTDLLDRAHGALAHSSATRHRVSEAASARSRRDRRGPVLRAG